MNKRKQIENTGYLWHYIQYIPAQDSVWTILNDLLNNKLSRELKTILYIELAS